MTGQVGEVNVKIGADTKDLKEGVDTSKNKLKELGDTADKTSKTTNSAFGSMGKSALQFAAAYVSIGAAVKAVKMADEFNLLETRVRTATKATSDFSAVFKELTANAIASGSSLDGTVSAFQTISASAKDLGKSNKDAIAFVDTFQKLGSIGGSSTEALNNSLRQMSQSMAGGIVRAEEFNSIIENTPEVARAIADGLNMSVGELRMAVLEGNLLANDVFDSLLSKTGDVNAQFGEMPVTLGRASESASTSIGLMLSQLDKTAGVTGFIADALESISNKATEYTSRMSDSAITDKAWELVDAQTELNRLTKTTMEGNERIVEVQQRKVDLIQDELRGAAVFERMNSNMARIAAENAAKQKAGEDAIIAAKTEALELEDWLADRQLDRIDNQFKEIDGINRKYDAEVRSANLEVERAKKAEESQAKRMEAIQAEQEFKKQAMIFEAEGTGEDQLDKEMQASANKLERLQENYLTEQELLRIDLEEKQFIIDEALLNEQISTEEHEALMTGINKEGMDARLKLKELERKQSLATTTNMLGALTSLMNSGSKELFEIGKVAAMANAGIKGASAVMSAWEAGMSTGGPWAPAVAAAYAGTAAITAASNISNISSQSYGGGATAGGAASFSSGTPVVNTQQQAAPEQAARPDINISATGDTFSRSTVLGIIDGINEAYGDGARIKVT